MKRLQLLRHAKSSWEDSGLADHERPLAPRGVRATRLIADHLRDAETTPQLVLCSTARRTRETLEGIRGVLGADADVRFEEELYGASGDTLLARVQALDDSVESVLVIGHNPGIGDLAMRLADVRGKYPTGALATIVFDASWQELGPEASRLAEFVTPKGLAGT